LTKGPICPIIDKPQGLAAAARPSRTLRASAGTTRDVLDSVNAGDANNEALAPATRHGIAAKYERFLLGNRASTDKCLRNSPSSA
jgi:hypothetical protein